MKKTTQKTCPPRKALKPRKGGSIVTEPDSVQKKEKSDGTFSKKSGSPRQD